ncbi:hypothetical protein GLYMA_10G048000v4 [Glycine max]|uniref:Uncharacterized protein n=1 Tax=Glycine max TaxID=3847 RepID=K7LHG9_SOYBN|nr:hypothetical protein JHK86_027073 [Glycine max]KAG5150705.1 hypothetical protein JHK84_027177 [Glycine max]KAH1136788.1 hypothetical protein GYH30_026987 [Glycine max]KHN39120.1 hypothetical protein glysoja_017414 [Glycine soja]KRH32377.1 hypothetical protein GLYMA_10G048000v4 [Glycine max]
MYKDPGYSNLFIWNLNQFMWKEIVMPIDARITYCNLSYFFLDLVLESNAFSHYQLVTLVYG